MKFPFAKLNIYSFVNQELCFIARESWDSVHLPRDVTLGFPKTEVGMDVGVEQGGVVVILPVLASLANCATRGVKIRKRKIDRES